VYLPLEVLSKRPSFLLLVAAACACGGTASRRPAERGLEENGGGGAGGTPDVSPVEPNCAVDLDGYANRHCAVYQDGSVWCWGVADSDQAPSGLGSSGRPERIEAVTGASRVFVGPHHSCGMTQEGLVCWGNNESMQIDESGISPRMATTTRLGDGEPAPWRSVALGEQQTCAGNALGHVYCRGTDVGGERRGATSIGPLGSAPNLLSTGSLPLVIEGGLVYVIDDWRLPSALPFYGSENEMVRSGSPSCAIKWDGSLWCGAYSIVEVGELARKEQLSEGALWVGTGDFFVCTLTESHRVWCDGWNVSGQLGRGVIHDSSQLLPGDWVEGLEDVQALSVARFSVCALTGDGQVSCWGAYGVEGTARPTPVSGCAAQSVKPQTKGRTSAE
jgi:hypothetical protein